MKILIPKDPYIILKLLKEKEEEAVPGKIFVPQTKSTAPKSRWYEILSPKRDADLNEWPSRVVSLGDNYPSHVNFDGEEYFICKEEQIVAYSVETGYAS